MAILNICVTILVAYASLKLLGLGFEWVGYAVTKLKNMLRPPRW